jgi:hypothetical protein
VPPSNPVKVYVTDEAVMGILLIAVKEASMRANTEHPSSTCTTVLMRMFRWFPDETCQKQNLVRGIYAPGCHTWVFGATELFFGSSAS